MKKKDKILLAIAIFAPFGISIALSIKAHDLYKAKKEKENEDRSKNDRKDG